jgi:acyl carrier protein
MDYKEIQAIVFAAASEMSSRDSDDRLTTTLSLDTTFADLDFDSVDGVEFACYLSDKFGLEIPELELCSLKGNSSRDYEKTRLRDVIDYIEQNYSRFEPTPTRN